MKIALNSGQRETQTDKAAQAKIIEREAIAAHQGDWNASNALVRSLTPLLTTLAEKRSKETAKVNRYIEAGREGIARAAKKYKPQPGLERFQIFVVDFIETSMDAVDKPRGFFARLFGG